MGVYRVQSQEELSTNVKNKDVRLACLICDAILANLNTTKKNVYVVTVEVLDEQETYDLSCNSADFIVTLEKNLEILIEYELYELCQEVSNGIKYLKQKNK
jgi:hypothetical protein